MRKKIIGITQRLAIQESYQERREILACEWGAFFEKNYLLPIPLSYEIPIREYSSILDGVILSGGNDLSIFYEDSCSKTRDEYEKTVIDYCREYQLPLLGVCRGAQILASYFGSTLGRVEGHVGEHRILWYDNEMDWVNSYHHYAILSLSKELQCEAKSEDGCMECFSHSILPFFGMMWHPEREREMSFSTKRMLEKFLENMK